MLRCLMMTLIDTYNLRMRDLSFSQTSMSHFPFHS